MSFQDEGERQESERRQREFTWLDMQRFRPGWWGPDRVPRPQPGDGWILLGMLGGAIAGGMAGGAIVMALGGMFVPSGVGMLVGALAGTLLGDRVKKNLASPRRQ